MQLLLWMQVLPQPQPALLMGTGLDSLREKGGEGEEEGGHRMCRSQRQCLVAVHPLDEDG